MRTCVFDIETTGLAAVGEGILLGAVMRPTDLNESLMLRIDGYKPNKKMGFLVNEEQQLLRDVMGVLEDYDLLVGHNINKFDLPFLRTRAYRQGVEYKLNPFTYDTYKAFRRIGILTRPNGFGRPSAGLAHVIDYLGIKQKKDGVYPVEWWKAIWGNTKERHEAMDKIMSHCVEDVDMNTQGYCLLLPQDLRASIKRLL